MRAFVLHTHGDPDVLRLEDLPIPEPGEFDILVEVHATSVNPVDTKVRSRVSAARAYPIVLGYDVSGIVKKCGARVSAFKVGDHVFGCPNLFMPGANAEYVLLDARAAALKPKSVSHDVAATLPLVSLTAWEALHERARIQPGQTVLIHAGAGGVGHIAIQIAKLHGCKVITTAGRAESLQFCREILRADEVIDYRQSDFVTRVNEITDGRGLPVIFDTVGGETFKRGLDCIAPCGQIVTILGADMGERAQLALMRSITIHYEFMGARVAYNEQPEKQAGILRAVAKLVDDGLLKPHVSMRFPLERVADAHRQLETGHTMGKVSVVVRND